MMTTKQQLMREYAPGRQAISDGTSPIALDGTWDEQSFREGDGGISGDALTALGLIDETRDPRWFSSFEHDGQRLGLYRDISGYYWCAWYIEVDCSYELQLVGTLSDVLDEYADDED